MTGRCTCRLPHGICPGGTCPCPVPHKMRADPGPHAARIRAQLAQVRPALLPDWALTAGLATLDQLTVLHAALAATGRDYPERAAYVSGLICRPVVMLSELTEDEACAVLDEVTRGAGSDESDSH